MASSVSLSGVEANGPTPSADSMVIHHTPMSERQQLALIKRLEKANAAARQNQDQGNDILHAVTVLSRVYKSQESK